MKNRPTAFRNASPRFWGLTQPLVVVTLAWCFGWLSSLLCQLPQRAPAYRAEQLSSQGTLPPDTIWIQPPLPAAPDPPQICSFQLGAHGLSSVALPSWGSATGAVHLSLGTRAQAQEPLLLILGRTLPDCRLFEKLGHLPGRSAFAVLRGFSWFMGAQVLVLPSTQAQPHSVI